MQAIERDILVGGATAFNLGIGTSQTVISDAMVVEDITKGRFALLVEVAAAAAYSGSLIINPVLVDDAGHNVLPSKLKFLGITPTQGTTQFFSKKLFYYDSVLRIATQLGNLAAKTLKIGFASTDGGAGAGHILGISAKLIYFKG
jgi:hypothetical protein